MGVSAKGISTNEALEKGKSLSEAVKIGDTSAAVEIGTEMISGGIPLFGKGALDDISAAGMKKIKNKVLRFFVRQGYDIGMENVEEYISDAWDSISNAGNYEPNKSMKEIIEDFKEKTPETTKTTILSTIILKTLTGGMYGDVRQVELEDIVENSSLEEDEQDFIINAAQNYNLSNEQVQDIVNTMEAENENTQTTENETEVEQAEAEQVDENKQAEIEQAKIKKVEENKQAEIDNILSDNNLPSENALDKAIEDTQKSIKENQQKLKTSKSEKNKGVLSKNIEVQTELLDEFKSIKEQITNIKSQQIGNEENLTENVETAKNQPSTMENKRLLESKQQTIQEESKAAENATSQEAQGIDKKGQDIVAPIDMDDNERVENVNARLLETQKVENNTENIVEHSQETLNNIQTKINELSDNNYIAENGWSEKNAIKEIQKILAQENNDQSKSLKKYEEEARKLFNDYTGDSVNELLDRVGMTLDEWRSQTPEERENNIVSYMLEPNEVQKLDGEGKGSKTERTQDDPEMQEALNEIRANSISNTMSANPMTAEQETLETQAQNDISLVTTGNDTSLPETYSLKDDIGKKTRLMTDKEGREFTTRIVNRPARETSRVDRMCALLYAAIVDKGAVYEDMDFRTKDIDNRSAQSAWQNYLNSTQQAYYALTKGTYIDENGSRTQIAEAIYDVKDEFRGNKQLEEEFNDYIYDKHNIDRMSLEVRAKERAKQLEGDLKTLKETYKKDPPKTKGEQMEYARKVRKLQNKINYLNKDVKNKMTRADKGIVRTAEECQKRVAEAEAKHPEFKGLSERVYRILDANNIILKNAGVISDDTIALFKELYPHYVPIDRVMNIDGEAINVPLDSKRTDVNSPIHRNRKYGGVEDFLNIFDAIENRTQQVYKAAARNKLGNTIFEKLGKINEIEGTIDPNIDIADFIETIGETEVVSGEKGAREMSIFQNGKRINFRINEDIKDSLQSASNFFKRYNNSKGAKRIQALMKARRNILTEWNPLFLFTNGIKDAQDVLFNSQHAARTYAKFPEAYAQIVKKGFWYEEYLAHGGFNASLFNDKGLLDQHEIDRIRGTRSGVQTVLDGLSDINRVVEMAPRLAEYIASREMGRSVETAMLDAARVTTNFSAGGDFGKFVNKNVSVFFNANVQGMAQQVRNIREDVMRGPKGWARLAVKGVLAQLPAMLLNSLRWDDDEDYEDLSDYVKNNYYCIAKKKDGTFVRIPKGRIVATLQKVGSTIHNYATGDTEFTMDNALDSIADDVTFAIQNIGVENPVDNTIGAPLAQVLGNEAWYGGPIIPSRLQGEDVSNITDESVAEPFNAVGRLLDNPVTGPVAKRLHINPITMQYLAEQYGGGWSNMLLSPFTPEAESTNLLLTPLSTKFTTNSNLNNQQPTDYYDNKAKLKDEAGKSNATDEDKLKYKYLDSFSDEIRELYEKEREMQKSKLPDKEKYRQSIDIRRQINSLAKQANDNFKGLKINGNTATIDDKMYYKDTKGEWNEVKDEDKPSGLSLEKYGKYKTDISNLTEDKKKKEGKDTASLTEAEKADYLLNADYSRSEKETIYESMIKKDDKKYDGLKAINSNSDINDFLKFKSNTFNKKAEAETYLNSTNYSGIEKLYLKGTSYKFTKDEKAAFIRYLNTLPLFEKEAILDGLSANNGKRNDNGTWEWK